ncbi:uncharacterized protein LOC141723448 [Apium graveolens]|uniref:uncharacterized protein LOC141723448 n=1 Tax=Apium graveolens TaxID=4045 RepID=UPI003D7A30AA
MGNHISCTLTTSTAIKNSLSTTKVIFPTGEIRHICEPVKAAELMLECPNFFVVNTKSLQIGRRFLALNADESLEVASAYVMFPMKRLKSVVTAADMGVLFLMAKTVSAGNHTRNLPEMITHPAAINKEEVAPKLNIEDTDEFLDHEFKHRLSMCRSKKPLLETIEEEPIFLR